MMKKSLLKNKKILFIGGANGKDDWMMSISKELERRQGITSFYLGILPGSKEYFLREGIPEDRVYSVWYVNQKKIVKPDINFIRRSETKYNFKLWDIWQITAPRKKFYLNSKSNTILCWAEYLVREMENLVKNVKPDYVVMYAVVGYNMVIMHNVLKENGVEILMLVNARIPARFTFNNNLEDKWPLLIEEYNKIKKRKLLEKEIKFAENFFNNFRDNPFKPDDSARPKVPLSKKIEKYKLYLQIFKYRKKLPDLRQFMWPVLDKLKDMSGIFEMPVKGEKYVFYPLHINPEASTSLFGKWYVNQLDLIEKISKSLPCDYKLYAKEHVFAYSSRPSWYYKEIKKFPNVRLISPHTNTLDLIKNSSLVLTITSTVGWESILLQKPVLVFGDVYYNIFDGIIKIKEISQLPNLIENNLNKKIDKNEIFKFIIALFNSTFEGIGTDPGDNFAALESKNVSLLVDGIEKYIDHIKK